MPRAGSCCQADICGIPCPATHPKPPSGFGIGIGIMIAFFCAICLAAFYFVGGKAENFFVAGRSLPLFVVTLTLASQSIDSNALLGTPTSPTSTTSTTERSSPSAWASPSSSTASSSRTR